MSSKMSCDTRNKEALAKQRKWDAVIPLVYENPTLPHECVFCGKAGVRASWSLIDSKTRLASFDAWCVYCGETTHLTSFLPLGTVDHYPVGVSRSNAQVVTTIYEVGKSNGWWNAQYGKRNSWKVIMEKVQAVISKRRGGK